MIGDGDLTSIFANGDFDEQAVFVITPAVLVPPTPAVTLTARGWFTDGSDATVMYGVEIEANRPTLMCPTASIATVRNKMTVTIRSVVYTVEKIERIGTGVSVVYLKS